jgi:hypothetical protein
VGFKVGVICRSCGRTIEIEDEYIRGISAIEMAAVFYKAAAGKFAGRSRGAGIVNIASFRRCGTVERRQAAFPGMTLLRLE